MKTSLLTRSGVRRFRSFVCMTLCNLQLRSLEADDVGIYNSNFANSCTNAYCFVVSNDHQAIGLYAMLSSRNFPRHADFARTKSCNCL
ncbi:hypothetical protein PR002_g26001 [Phytophthora rubi]|uniref:Uncharacterized protein n=1 Tax=Phytophthora rubi TaxID=129364 RepID=A0A6A3HXI8_9STRA|nr:hypothetical protein PR002_g26001 [Phytophthora rubi]